MGPVVRTSAWVAPFRGFCPQRWVIEGSYILMPERPGEAQQYNRFDGPFGALNGPVRICNLEFDTPKAAPYKRGSHGERGVPETSRVIAAKGFATRNALPVLPKVSTLGRALYASSVWKGIRQRRRTFAPSGREGFCRR